MAACVLLAAAPGRAVDDSTEKFIAQIISGARTNSERAAKLLDATKALAGQPKVCLAVLEKAVEFGTKSPVTPAGCKAAGDALDRLEADFPDRRDEWTLKRAAACRARYRCTRDRSEKQAAGRELLAALLAVAEIHEKSGNWTRAAARYREAVPVDAYLKAGNAKEIRRKYKAAVHFATTTRRVAQYAALLKKDPSKASTRALLVKLLVVELNDPARAQPYLNEDVDEKWRTCVPLAAKALADLPESVCLELGRWYYKELSKNASSTGKGMLLRRAMDYYKRFVELHAKVDIQAFRAKAALASIEKELAKLGGASATGARVGSSGGKTLTLNLGAGVTMKLMRIPAGKFMMGSPKTETGRMDNEGPRRRVTIGKAFYMGVTEVTRTQYRCVTDKDKKFTLNKEGPRYPQGHMSWHGAMAFCTAMSKKTGRTVSLPTEAQWEYACRAGTKTRFSFGDDDKDFDAYGWSKDNSGGDVHPVGRKKPNPFGLYDMHGNVLEWCRDSYDANFYAKAKNVDPENTTKTGKRVLRGGSWDFKPDHCSAAHRHQSSPNAHRLHGFRVVVGVGS